MSHEASGQYLNVRHARESVPVARAIDLLHMVSTPNARILCSWTTNRSVFASSDPSTKGCWRFQLRIAGKSFAS